ncbi:uncharacterized protein LOC144108632 [Amblyomma americanum]|uniref:Uncharacterized protein n=1 Tax=Amblyomma americanum TaxID=6943 RepID=A0AAQ4E7A8_AMBAM
MPFSYQTVTDLDNDTSETLSAPGCPGLARVHGDSALAEASMDFIIDRSSTQAVLSAPGPYDLGAALEGLELSEAPMDITLHNSALLVCPWPLGPSRHFFVANPHLHRLTPLRRRSCELVQQDLLLSNRGHGSR